MNDLETEVLLQIGEDPSSPDVFTDTETGIAPIRQSINDAVQEITMLTGGYKETFYIPLVKDQTFYRLSFQKGHFGWVTDAWIENVRRRLFQVDLGWLDNLDPRWMVHSGPPERYFQVGLDIVGFYRRPGSTSDVVRLDCVVLPEYELGTEPVQLRDNFRWAVVSYAVAEYWASRGDAKAATDAMEKYTDVIGSRLQYRSGRESVEHFRTAPDPALRTHNGRHELG